jgi:hypothetical protein
MNTIPIRSDVLEAERLARAAAALNLADTISDEISDALGNGATVPGCPVYFNKDIHVAPDVGSILTSRFSERGWSLVITHGAGVVKGCCIFLAK